MNYYDTHYPYLDDEGRALANLLAQDLTLYRMGSRLRSRFRPEHYEDFLHDFFLYITHYAKSFPGSFLELEELTPGTGAYLWVSKCMNRFRSMYWRNFWRQFWGSKKPEGKPALRIYTNQESTARLDSLAAESYKREKRLYLLPDESEEDRLEFERHRQRLNVHLEAAMEGLRESEKKVIRLFYFHGLPCKTIARIVGMTYRSVIVALSNGRKSMRKNLPESIFSTTAWIRGDYRPLARIG